MKSFVQRPSAGLWLAAAALLMCAALLAVPHETLSDWTQEDAFFEQGSVVGWLLAAVALLALARRYGQWRLHGFGAAIMTVFAMRELDWHKAFTTDSLFKSNYYLDVPAPLTEKVIAGGVALAILWLLIHYAIHFARPMLCGLWNRSAPAISVASGVVLVVFSKVVDRSVSVLEDDWHVAVPDWFLHLQTAVEEPLEFTLPLFFLLAALQYHLRQSPGNLP